MKDPTHLEQRFDRFTKALAHPTPRRGVLQGIVGTVIGAVVATFAPGQALAGGGNSDCAHFCASVFGADTTAAGQCTSDAAHGKGLCYTCGPASAGGTKPICCPGGSGHCSSYSSATCCSSSQTCCGGACTTCPTGGVCSGTSCVCPSGQTNCNGTCTTCPTGGVCSGTSCVCPSGQTNCNGNCTTCPSGGVCSGTSCVCPSGQSNCSGTCVNEQTDPNHCGACGTICTGTTPGCCSGSCKDLSNDGNNCGSCGHECASGQTCQNGTCAGPSCSFECPPVDLAGRPLQAQSTTSTELFCRYQTIPNDFFCAYFPDTGLLRQDHDNGFCPPVAIPNCSV